VTDIGHPRAVSPEVKTFMAANGRTHIKLTNAWRVNPRMANTPELLLEQFAWAVQNKGNRQLLIRILGRLRIARAVEEDKYLDELFRKDQQTLGVLA